jgi:hypothetical protein
VSGVSGFLLISSVVIYFGGLLCSVVVFSFFFVGWPGSSGGLCFAFHYFVVWLFCLVRLLWAVEGLIQGECFDDGEKRGG